MQPPFDEHIKDIAANMGISVYQTFTLNEASLFLRCPESDLQILVNKKSIQYIQVSNTEIQFFGYQLLQHLLNNIAGNPSPKQTKTARPKRDTQDRILRSEEVQKIAGVSRTTLWRMERKGLFPSRVPLGTGSIGWRMSDIEEWLKSK